MRDDASFVSLGATFKPDDASTLATTETERNWNNVLAEAIVVPHESDVVPVAQAVTVDAETFPPTVAVTAEDEPPDSTVHRCNFMVIIIGYSLLLFAVAAAFGTELGAVVLYLVGAGFCKISALLERAGSITRPFQTLFLILCAVMLWCDLLILTFGIFVVELIGWIACVLCILFGGIAAGTGWHQHIRKVCHLTRWTFRGFHSTWTPKRLQPFGKSDTGNENNDQSANTGPSISVDNTADYGLEKDGNSVKKDCC